VVLIAAGGLIGSLARYGLAGVTQRLVSVEFPVGTLVVNTLGSFVIGLIMVLSLDRGLLSAEARTFMTVGVCGGFTTMSTFGYETLALLREGETLLACLNTSANFVACVGAVWLGSLAGRYV
jgi:CrcB protein